MKIIKLRLKSPKITISARVISYKRNEKEYQIPHLVPGRSEKIPGPHIEVNITQVISQLIGREASRKFFCGEQTKEKLFEFVRGRHIEIGDDLHPYICSPRLYEEDLEFIINLWLAHQALYAAKKLDISYFESWFNTELSFDEWFEKYKAYLSDEHQGLIQAEKEFFISGKRVYKEGDEGLVNTVLKLVNATVSVEIN